MTELLTAAQMRAIETAAIESGEVTGLELMERAGRGVVEAVFEEWPELAATSHRAVVLCGPGNNGGDGFVVARLLKEWGWEVEVFLYGDPGKLPPDAKVNCERWLEIGEVAEWNDSAIEDILDERTNGLVIDALFGTGLTRPMPDDTLRTWRGFVPTVTHYDTATRPKYVAIDAPSGLCTDSGANLGAFPADLTVTFHTAKVGHYLIREAHYGGGPGLSGTVVVKDIGLQHEYCKDIVQLLEGPKPLRPKWMSEHKYSHGHALILSGGAGKTGAARLAARGALRIGAGVVTLGVPGSAQLEVAAQITAVMLRWVEDDEALTAVLEDQRIKAQCLGPGFGSGEREKALIGAALEAKRPTVLDADALSILFFDEADALFGKLHEKCVLTPHAGEFARMFPDIAEKLNAPAIKGPAYSKVDATREAAKRAGCVVLFKGPDTVIAAPDGQCSINSAHYERAAPWLATAGSGDVLAGFITGLLARGFQPMQAAETGAWLHVECARSFGPGLIAEDLPEELPKVFRDLGL
ncbi:Bifunctional NAD(P)H-hydrate repair enzyme Nnr [Roseovarius litorisediminis]|uniref:Bifunctional NAD(P)H-hydrate repair enzyme n=1 Tax=Roseovarius litorisediminis TaxID=1312363 RepID=A0A1Y5SAT2_9RHOB|nr:NAD(P)H-hydrate dehydratase [Roseovarius litorisediminis]SLN36382.1 Bifunctional NAD(P)H-hydrate repair enzyme Nnr [Roseovarius litorisediminis]